MHSSGQRKKKEMRPRANLAPPGADSRIETAELDIKNTIINVGPYIQKMPLSQYSAILKSTISETFDETYKCGFFKTIAPYEPKKEIAIEISLFYNLIQLAKMYDNDKSYNYNEEQISKLKNLQVILFTILADDSYYSKCIAVLDKHFLPSGPESKCALDNETRNDFLSILISLEEQRTFSDLSVAEISKLYKILDPNSGKIAAADAPTLPKGDISRLASALKREEENLQDVKKDDAIQALPIDKKTDSNEQPIPDIRDPDTYIELYEKFKAPADRKALLDDQKKINDVQKIFIELEKKLQQSWISSGRIEKLSDTNAILAILTDNKIKPQNGNSIQSEKLLLVKAAIEDRTSTLEINRKNCAISFAASIRNGLAYVGRLFFCCAPWGQYTQKPSNSKKAIDLALETLNKP